jgi:hypothetical protein
MERCLPEIRNLLKVNKKYWKEDQLKIKKLKPLKMKRNVMKQNLTLSKRTRKLKLELKFKLVLQMNLKRLLKRIMMNKSLPSLY